MRVIFHPEAHEEMIEQARYYEAKSESLGSDFLSAVEEATQRIRQFPKAGPIDRADIRKRLVSGFSFHHSVRNTA
jgi:plasmid stabilization system protein ParE